MLDSILITALLVALAGLPAIWRWRSRVSRREAAETAEAVERAAAARALVHEQSLSEKDREHRANIEVLEEARDTAQSEAGAARSRLATSWRSEAVSHGLIVDACAARGLEGVLVTNLVFVPSGGPTAFLAQIDHVFFTRWRAMIIESKYWQGAVFDGVVPSTVHPSHGVLMDESPLTGSFAVQIVPEEDSHCTVRLHRGPKAPTVQVRLQAQRLAAFVEQRTGAKPWFDTAVLYSHSRAAMHVVAEETTATGVRTLVIGGPPRLAPALIDSRTTSLRTAERREELISLFASQGAIVEEVGPRS